MIGNPKEFEVGKRCRELVGPDAGRAAGMEVAAPAGAGAEGGVRGCWRRWRRVSRRLASICAPESNPLTIPSDRIHCNPRNSAVEAHHCFEFMRRRGKPLGSSRASVCTCSVLEGEGQGMRSISKGRARIYYQMFTNTLKNSPPT